jgi:tRNA (guanine-N7-)-methyltransferase
MQSRREALETLLAASLPSSPQAERLVWEVGCGHGHFLTAYATAHPDRRCVGIDIASERISRATRKQSRAGLANLQFVQADGMLFLETLPAHVRLADVFILFPDPWPKSRHHKHRLIQPEFLTALARRAAPGAQLYFRTDHEPYFADALATLRAHADWTLLEGAPWPFEFETVFQSRATEGYQSFVARRASSSPGPA